MRRRALLLGGVALGVVAMAAALVWAASVLPLPSRQERSDLHGWYAEVGVAQAVMVLARLTATGLTAWLAASVLLQLLASALPQVHRLADAVSPSILRGLVGGMASLSLGVVAAPDLGTGGQPGTATLQPVEAESTTSSTDGDGVARLRPIDGREPDTTTSTTLVPPGASSTTSVVISPTTDTTSTTVRPASQHPPAPPAIPAPTPAPSDDTPAGRPGDRHVVVAGDHFWSLAHELVAEAQGGAATDRDVARYWCVLVEANRDRLAVPGEVDLLYVGQELLLPPIG
ncbi:MAG: LysM peptidoglycan-binding domain-containing protein [Acidimicrobiales bacterium]